VGFIREFSEFDPLLTLAKLASSLSFTPPPTPDIDESLVTG
jgi:hypothetical protein